MLVERIEAKWIDTFARAFALCRVQPSDEVAILSETQSRGVNVQLAELALLRMGAKPFHLVMPSPPLNAPVPVRSTGSSVALGRNKAVVRALTSGIFIADLTVEGLMHSEELPEIMQAGSRVLYVSDEHPDTLERLAPDETLIPRVLHARTLLRACKEMRVTSAAGTDLTIRMDGARIGGNLGASWDPSTLATWPGGIASCFPPADAVNGTLVLDEGDINITFKRYLEKPVTLRIERDYVRAVEGKGLDADLTREYFASWNDPEAYGTSHVGWGMNTAARWESMILYDKAHTNGIEQRAFAGNFLFSTGANPFVGRQTLGHFDLPVRRCTITLDGHPVVVDGKLTAELA